MSAAKMWSSLSEMWCRISEMKLRDEKMEQLIRYGDEKKEQATRNLAQKLDNAIEIRERVA